MPFFLLLVAAGVISHLNRRHQDEGNNQRENCSSSETSHAENIRGDSFLDVITTCCVSSGSGISRDDECDESSREDSILIPTTETRNVAINDAGTTAPTDTSTVGAVDSNESTVSQEEHPKDSTNTVFGDSIHSNCFGMKILRSGTGDDVITRACEFQYHRIPTDELEEEQSVSDAKNHREILSRGS